jgi:multisubunit Na+/H+ antiporter MnhC subunit
MAVILGLCAAGVFSIGGFLLAVDAHSWDVIVPSTLLLCALYLFLARWAYRDWQHKPRQSQQP